MVRIGYMPHNYQTFAADFIKRQQISAIFLDCGLGKTIITLSAVNDLLFDSFQAHRVLIVAPLRVLCHVAGRNPKMGSSGPVS